MSIQRTAIYNVNGNGFNYKNQSNPSHKPSYKGIFIPALEGIKSNAGFEAAVIDLLSMVIPRSVIESNLLKKIFGGLTAKIAKRKDEREKEKTKININSAIETLIRESSTTVNVCLTPGFIAMGSGIALQKAFSGKYQLETPANSEMVNFLHQAWKKTSSNKRLSRNERLKQYVRKVFSDVEGVSHDPAKKKVIKNIPENLVNDIVAEIQKTGKSKGKDLKKINQKLIEHLGAGEKLTCKINNTSVNASMNHLLEGTVHLGKNIFSKVPENELAKVIKKIGKLNWIKSAIGLGIATGIGLSIQRFNRYMSEKRTGKKGFVGYDDYGKEDSSSKKTENSKAKRNLLIGKAVSTLGFSALVLLSMGAFKPKTPIKGLKEFFSPANLRKTFEFSGRFPNANQLRLIYAGTILGRIFAADDKTELKETNIRDNAGYINWLVLSGFVTNVVAHAFDRGHGLVNIAKTPQHGFKKVFDYMGNITLKSPEEIRALAKNNPALEKQLMRGWAGSVSAGIGTSMLMLGLLIPIINKVTRKRPGSDKKPVISNNTAHTKINVSSLNTTKKADLFKSFSC